MKKYLFLPIALILVFSLFTNIYAQPINKDSNYYKNCIKMTDKRVRSIECPGVFPKGESSFVPGG